MTRIEGARRLAALLRQRFDPATERLFRRRRVERVLPTVRFGCVAACFIFAAFFFRDRYLAPEREGATLALRFVACAFYLGLLPATRYRWFQNRMAYLVPIGTGVGSLCVSIIAALVPRGFDIGIGGPLLLIMAAPVVAPTAASALVTCLVAIAVPNVVMRFNHEPWLTVFSSNHYLVLGGVLSVGIALLLERDARRAFRLELELERAASTDPLTGLFNRRRFLELAEAELARARRYGHALSVVMIDLDHFKQVNDRFGHDAGDAVLRILQSRFVPCLRRNDALGRLGGEEFAVVLPETDRAAAAAVAERLRASLESAPIPVHSGSTLLTLSAGCIELGEADADVDSLLRRADAALYEAKRAGRNRVEVG